MWQLLKIPKGENMRGKSLALIAAAAAAAVAGITSKSEAQAIYYRPVVTLFGDGSAVLSTTASLTTIQLYNYAPSSQTGAGATDQSSPIAASAYVSDGSANSLVNAGNSTTEGDLENNPGLDDAATAGLAYSGTAYVFSGGYQGTADVTQHINSTANANRVVGYMSVTGNSVSSGTIGDSMTFASTYAPIQATPAANIRSAVGDDTPTDGNFWMAGTGNSTATSGFQASFRYGNVNTVGNSSTELTTSAQNNRRVQIRQGQLYGGSDTGNFTGISLVGDNSTPSNLSGLPTTLTSPGVTALFSTSLQPPNSSAVSPLSFVLMDDPNNPSTPTVNVTVGTTTTPVSIPFNVAYVADENANNNGFEGIEKWTYNPANGTTAADNFGWSLDYVIPDPKAATGGNIGLAGEMILNPSDPTQDEVQLFSTDNAAAGTQNYLIQTTDLIDTGTQAAATASQVILAESPSNEAFRGVARRQSSRSRRNGVIPPAARGARALTGPAAI